MLLSVTPYHVSTNADDGAGSLREAIREVNQGLFNGIVFDSGMTISPATSLPAITSPVTILGQTDSSGHPLVRLDGIPAGPGAVGLELNAAGSVVQGLSITGFKGSGIVIDAAGSDTIQGNWIGLDLGGNIIGNGTGISVLGGNNTIGGTATGAGNVISGNDKDGVDFASGSAAGNVLAGNWIGLDITGELPFYGNFGNGVALSGSNNVLIQNNTISGNGSDGILLTDSSSNTIQANFIGTDVHGLANLDANNNPTVANNISGIELAGNSGSNLIGGAGMGNVLSGNFLDGVTLNTTASMANVIKGNLIGIDVNHALDPNSADGINVIAGPAIIGGAAAGEGNVISSNLAQGLDLGAGGTIVLGNYIGVDASGASMGNAQNGVLVHSSGNVIGGADPGDANVIAHSGAVFLGYTSTAVGAGVYVQSGNNNAIRGNSIFSNNTMGINFAVTQNGAVIEANQPVLNDSQGHVGPNNYQDFPVLSSVTISGNSVTVKGHLNGDPAGSYALDLFANASADATGYGQGQVYLGTATIAGGDFSVTFSNVTVSQTTNLFSATTTDAAGNTSEFAQDVAGVQGGPVITPLNNTTTLLTSSAPTSTFGDLATFTATISGGTSDMGGVLSFFSNGNLALQVTLAAGQTSATWSTSALGGGSYTITAQYSGDNKNQPSQAGLLQTVNRASSTTTLNASVSTLTLGQQVMFTAVVAPGSNTNGVLPTGSVMFMDGNTPLATVALDATGTAAYTTNALSLGTHVITAVYNSDSNFAASASSPLTESVTPAAASISGHTYFDVTGDGLSADDKIMGGVTVQLFLDKNGNGTLDAADGGPVATVVSDQTTGAYSFVNLAPGTYFVEEVTPNGFLQTAPAASHFYSNTMTSGTSVSNDDFDNFQQCNCKNSVSGVSFLIDGKTRVSDLRGHVHQGDTVQVTFDVLAGHTDVLSLVSYTAPGSSFNANTASQQKIYQDASGVFGPGWHSLTVVVPQCYFQIDFVCGYAIDHFGPAGSNIFYSAQGRLISADNGGTKPPPVTTH